MPGTVTVRNIIIGEGIPKIIVPIAGSNSREIFSAAKKMKCLAADVVEWRADYFEEALDAGSVIKTLAELREILGDIPLLFSFRTFKEGGEKSISLEQYEELIIMAAKSGYADLIDVEIFSADASASGIIEAIHEADCLAVGSNHDFYGTPEKNEIISRLIKIQDTGADILKIAVMPVGSGDVLALLEATAEMTEKYSKRPVVTMSMSGKGVISRIAGEMFGSAMTFGSAGKKSAPGQMPAEELSVMLQMFHRALQQD